MSELITLLFNYVKLDSEGFSLKKERVNITEFMLRIAADVYTDMEDAGMEYDVDIPEAAGYAEVDKAQFTRAMNNLITNAVKHNRPGTKIKICMKKEFGSWIIRVMDSRKKIEEILQTLVSDSKRSIEKMEEVNKHLKEQQDNLKSTQSEFANVSSGIVNTRSQSGLVDGQAKECDISRGDVVDIISRISSISERNAASTQETTASIQELTATINLVNQQAVEVKEQAQILEEAMQFFKL